ncbi:MAG: polysaccharide biosynthesis protein [Bacteroidaceae bacterium]|nr:polysaccharide biosynthesis protein [Bacteroidaceae bacterium]
MLNFLKPIARWYFSKSATPYWMVLAFDCFAVVAANLIVYILDMGATYTAMHFWPLMGTLFVYLIPYLIGFRIMRTYSGVMRYSSFSDLYRVAIANFIGIASVEFVRLFLHTDHWLQVIKWHTLLFAWLLATGIMFAARLLIKYLFDTLNEERALSRVFIYGTKSGGQALAKSIRVEQPQRFRLRGFLSDSKDMPGHTLQGVPVYRNDDSIIDIMKSQQADVLLVSPLKSQRLMANSGMTERLIDAGIKILTIQQEQEWDGKSDISAAHLHNVDIEDLLPRDEIEVDLEAVEHLLRGRRIMITGSAGSIGSELVRQIAQWEPSQLVLIDQAETPQHDIRLMMARDFAGISCEAVVTSVCHRQSMERLFAQYKPEYVFHAAAYKHVPMMEDNPTEAVKNNIGGTRILADLAVKYGVKKFVMISTDKAVNPTNVMGCSKRICEIYVQALDSAIKAGTVVGHTQFVTTRFGNVLGSNGSVIPLFREQIRHGGPVTVTHPDIIRFFMLIPEACKLVLEAGTMGNGGEIFVFDMGKPVRIADLARRMILLSGAKNVEIKYTGLRDGEKLYEEVLNDKERTKPTFNSKIKIAQVQQYDYADIVRQLDELACVSEQFDNMQTVRLMKQIVPEYKSQNSVYTALDEKN